MNDNYSPSDIEKTVQTYWEENNSFEVKENLNKEKFYCLSMLPYPSGELHVGHVRNYMIGDIIARYHRLKGRHVLQPMGWDAFGLPAENAAIQRQLSPSEWTEKNIKKMRQQFKRLGFAYDWQREITTCEPQYYHWEQWLFVQLYKKGLAYKKEAVVNWDPIDQTVLANEQVIDGRGWRSGAIIEQRKISQWFLRITDYAEELLAGLEKLEHWPKQVTTMQRHWIGRSQGVTIQFDIENRKNKLDIFTTRPDTLMGVTYLAIAPAHPLAQSRAKQNKKIAEFIEKCRHIPTAEANLATQEKAGIDVGLATIHPITQEKLPIWIANFVLMEYGSGAIMSVPAHDERDHDFAKQYNLPIRPVIEPPNKKEWDYQNQPYTDQGQLINSGLFDGLNSESAFDVILEYLKTHKIGDLKINYRLHDWGISRQRYWGTPIPIIYCKDCGTVPVPEAALPVLLPDNLVPTGKASPLETCEAFYKTKCPKCGKSARRETDTMDTFVESSWYYARYCCPDQDNAMLDDRAKYWTPVDQYVGGIEHAVMHLLYARFIHKVLRDIGLLNSNEPFTALLTQGMVLKDGHKMSKSKGNVVTPQPLIKKYGADTLRLFIIFAAPPEHDLEWSDSGIEGAHRFLKKLWAFAYHAKTALLELNQNSTPPVYKTEQPIYQKIRRDIHQHLQQANHDIERQQLNTVVSGAMKILNVLSPLSVTKKEEIYLIHEGLSILLRLLSPVTPHITHYLWNELEFGADILKTSWPKPDNKALQTTHTEIVVQVNGKLRGKIRIPSDASEEDIKKTALQQDNIQKQITDKKIKKMIVVPHKLLNIVV